MHRSVQLDRPFHTQTRALFTYWSGRRDRTVSVSVEGVRGRPARAFNYVDDGKHVGGMRMEGGELRQRVDGGGGAGVGEAEAVELVTAVVRSTSTDISCRQIS